MSSTENILGKFEKISAIPRGSKNEAALRQWLIEWSLSRGLNHKTDEAGNLAVYVPASAGRENTPVLILQCHLDMVCQKTLDSAHDFTRDPIRNIRNGDWLKADKTTLGADNGIAIAIVMTLIEDESASHPPLELLFTVEEETGLVGASQLDPSLLTGKLLINLDTEDEGTFTVGCAGGMNINITLPVKWSKPYKGETALELKISGLQGGHSGVDIHKQRGNANKILARALEEIQRVIPIRLVTFTGGTARNAIPRDAAAIFVIADEKTALCTELVKSFEQNLQSEFASAEAGLYLSLSKNPDPATTAIGIDETHKGIQLIAALPNGVAEMSAEVQGAVETSNNIGVIELLKDGLHIGSSQRSSVISRLEELSRRIEAISTFADAKTERAKMSLPWQPNMDSPLLKKCVEVYESLYQQKPIVEVCHGGLECGIISKRCDGIDAISLGPTIINPHSPDEALFIPSLSKTWDFLIALLRS